MEPSAVSLANSLEPQLIETTDTPAAFRAVLTATSKSLVDDELASTS